MGIQVFGQRAFCRAFAQPIGGRAEYPNTEYLNTRNVLHKGNEVKYTYEELAGLIDHALLTPTMTDAEMEAGCRIAADYKVASVCVKPYFVRRAAEILRGSGVGVGTVIGFPHGSPATEVKRYETEIACRDGATEVDMVTNIGKAYSGDWEYVAADIRAVVEEAKRHNALVKVIFETDFLPDDAMKTKLCRISAAAGADYVKTSTGFGFVKGKDGKYSYVGATPHDLELMRSACPPNIGVKASGGIRDLETLILCRDLGCGRVGASATQAMLDEYRRREANPEAEKTADSMNSVTEGY